MSDKCPPDKNAPPLIGEALIRLWEENRKTVIPASTSAIGWLVEPSPALQALHTGLQKLGLTIGDAITELRISSEERMALYPKLHSQVGPLAQRGWFLTGEMGMSDLMKLAEISETATEAELDEHVAALYRDDIENQMLSLLREYPHREFVLKPALNAHQRGEFALSVPIFFVQADGIAFEGCDRYLFQNKKGEAALREMAEEELQALSRKARNPLSQLQAIMWQPLAKPLPISYNPQKRKEHGYTGLNRNTVLHGIASSEYATEENSLKAFSLLSYVASLMSERKQIESLQPKERR